VIRSPLKNQQGVEIVEFAIVSLLLFLLLFGIIDFGILLFNKAVITNASREGARAGIVQRWDNNVSPATYDPLDSTEIETVVNNYLSNHLITFGGLTTATTTVTDSDTTGDGSFGPGDQRSVQVTYAYYFLVPGFIGGPTITLTAETAMRME
jgi:Flp pilus assembly protein TadG